VILLQIAAHLAGLAALIDVVDEALGVLPVARPPQLELLARLEAHPQEAANDGDHHAPAGDSPG
jgi:hypothetical protein